MRGIRTLDVRLDKHQENAKKVASFLSKTYIPVTPKLSPKIFFFSLFIGLTVA